MTEQTQTQTQTQEQEQAAAVRKALEERLVEHNENRKEVQKRLALTCEGLEDQINELEARLLKELEDKHTAEENRLREALVDFEKDATNSENNMVNLTEAILKVKDALVTKSLYEIEDETGKDISCAYKVVTKSEKPKDFLFVDKETIFTILNERIDDLDEKRRTAQEKAINICEDLRRQGKEMKEDINSELEVSFIKEDKRLQATLARLKFFPLTDQGTTDIIRRGRIELSVKTVYSLNENNERKDSKNIKSLYVLTIEKEVVPQWLDKPRDFRVNKIDTGRIYVVFTPFNPDQEKVFLENDLKDSVTFKASLNKTQQRKR